MGATRPPRPQKTPDGRPFFADHWGLTKAQLHTLVEACRQTDSWDDGDNIRAFVEKYVIPMTLGTGMGLALKINQAQPLKVTTMISHTWDENAVNFFEDLAQHVKDEEVMFICCFSLFQAATAVGAKVEWYTGDGQWQHAVIRKQAFKEGCMSYTLEVSGVDCEGGGGGDGGGGEGIEGCEKSEGGGSGEGGDDIEGNGGGEGGGGKRLLVEDVPSANIRTPRRAEPWTVVSRLGERYKAATLAEAEEIAKGLSFGCLMFGPDGKELEGKASYGALEQLVDKLPAHKLRGRFLAEYEAFAGPEPTIAQQLGNDISDGPFKRVIDSVSQSGGRMIIVTCAETVLYTRLWCVWEAYVAVVNGIRLAFINRGKLFSSSTRLQDAVCSSLADTQQIQSAIASGAVPSYNSYDGLRWVGVAGAVALSLVDPPLALVVAALSLTAGRDKRSSWDRLESVLKHAIVESDHVDGKVDQAVFRTVKDAPGFDEWFRQGLTHGGKWFRQGYYAYRKRADSLGEEVDITEEANGLISRNGIADVTGGRPLREVLRLESRQGSDGSPAGGRHIVTFRAGGHEASFSADGSLTKLDLRPLIGEAWSQEPLRFEVVQATYRGIWDKDKKVDVTAEVNELLRVNGPENMTGNTEINTALGVKDPARKQAKELELTVVGHHTRAFSNWGVTSARTTFDLTGFFESDPHVQELVAKNDVPLVMRAIYRAKNKPGKFVNVTNRLIELCQENPHNDITAGCDLDTALGVDPAPYWGKELVVTTPRLKRMVYPELNLVGFAVREYNLRGLFKEAVLGV